jgi:hypothetical protein
MTLLAIALFLGIIALRPLFEPALAVQAQAAKFDHVFIVSTMYLYKGQQGLLVMDRRNGNIWFIARQDNGFQDPAFVMRMQWEKLDQTPPAQ